MKRKERRTRRQAFRQAESSILAILSKYEPVPGSPADEWECVVHEILSALHRGGSTADIANAIQASHWGGLIAQGDANLLAAEVMEWWGSNSGESMMG